MVDYNVNTTGMDFHRAGAGMIRVPQLPFQEKNAMKHATEVCEIIMTKGMTVSGGKIGAGISDASNAAADEAAQDFVNSQGYKDLKAVRSHGDDLARSMAALINERVLYAQEKTPEAKQSRLETMGYTLDLMNKRGWKGSQKPPFPESPSVSGNTAGRVSAQTSMKGRPFSTPRVQ